MKKRGKKKRKKNQSTQAADEQAGGSGGDGGGAMLPGSADEAPAHAHPAGLPNPDAQQGSKGSGKQTTHAESGTVHS